MSRLVVVIVIAVLALGAASATWWVLGARRNASPPPLAPPEAAKLDPLIAADLNAALEQARQSPRSASKRVHLAMTYHANGLLALAASTYEQALQMKADDAHAWYHLAQVRWDQGNTEEAFAALDRAIALERVYAPAHWRRGFWLLDAGDIDAAEASFKQALSIDSASVAANVGLARVAIARRQYDQATQRLNQLIAANPQSPNMPYLQQLLGTAQRTVAGSTTAATMHALLRSSGMDVAWPDPWSEQVQALQTGHWANLERADQLIDSGQGAAVMPFLQDLARKRPNDAMVLNYLAKAHFALKQWDNGIAVLQRALALQPDHVTTHLNLSHGYEGKGDQRLALQHAQHVVTKHPSVAAGHLQVGRLMVIADKPEAAVEPLTLALQLGIIDPKVRTMLGQTHLRLSNWSEAARHLQQSVRDEPSAAAFLGLALAKAEQGATPEALTYLQAAEQLNPKEPNLKEIGARVRHLHAASAPPG